MIRYSQTSDDNGESCDNHTNIRLLLAQRKYKQVRVTRVVYIILLRKQTFSIVLSVYICVITARFQIQRNTVLL